MRVGTRIGTGVGNGGIAGHRSKTLGLGLWPIASVVVRGGGGGVGGGDGRGMALVRGAGGLG